MSNRIKGFTVTLSQDIKDEDFESIKIALSLIKNVIHIEPSIVNVDDHFNRERVLFDLRNKLYDLIK